MLFLIIFVASRRLEAFVMAPPTITMSAPAEITPGMFSEFNPPAVAIVILTASLTSFMSCNGFSPFIC